MHLFICCAGRSGSTLLDMLLGGHSQIASLGEFSMLGKAVALDLPCSCGQPVSVCEQWRRVLERVARETGVDLFKDPYALWQWDTRSKIIIDPAQQTRSYLLATRVRALLCDLRFHRPAGSRLRVPLAPSLASGVRNTLALYEAIRAEWGKQVTVDSSKNVHKALAVYEARPADTRIILLTRDGRGVYWSSRRSGFGPSESVSAWLTYYRRAMPLLRSNVARDRWVTLRYEDLVTDAPATMRKLAALLGLSYEPTMAALGGKIRHLVHGNETRMAQERPLVLDERWKREMGHEDLAFFNANAAQLNTQLGYAEGSA